ncbi:MAG: glycosyltransferase family 9 protein [Nitrospira sp.]|nr:glycosyltransferase family 9 protein [Nitrospira sp.]MBH0196073.1 glycosyltransferase family 9 protein [Nitrospira sp.]
MKREIHSALVVCTRRIGDVLLATPVVRSIKAAYPDAAVDMLVFEGTQGVVAANPDIRRIWTIIEHPPIGTHLKLLRSIRRRYDLVISVLAGDRPTFHAWVAGRYRVGTLLADAKSWWKRRLLDEWVPFDNLNTHTVAMNLRLLEPLNVVPLATPVVSWRHEDEVSVRRLCSAVDGTRAYAVLHVSPKFVYKTWTVAGWEALGRWLTDQGLTIAVTGGDAPGEGAFCEDVVQRLPKGTVNLVGQVGLPALGYLLSRATLYVGTDTAVSHMAAAVGAPTIVLFGPSNPVKWGPWPKDFPLAVSPWKKHGSQRQGNVFLLQGEGDCVPCLGEGCDRHINSVSDCLQQLPAGRVIEAARMMLAERQDRHHTPLSMISSRV